MVKIVAPDKVSGMLNEALGIDNSNWDYPTHLSFSHLNMNKLMPVSLLEPGINSIEIPVTNKADVISEIEISDPLTGRKLSFETFLNRRLFNDALAIFHKGELVHESYRNGMQPEDHHICHSMTKSLTAMLIGIAIDEGVMKSEQPISAYIQELSDLDFWKPVTLRHMLDMNVGSQYSEDYTDSEATYFSYARSVGYYPPLEGEKIHGARGWLSCEALERIEQVGNRFNYCSPLTNALLIAAGEAYQQDPLDLLEDKIFKKTGMEDVGWFNTDKFGVPIAEGQLSLRLRDFIRWAALMVCGGRNLAGEQVVPESFITDTITPNRASMNAFSKSEYGCYFDGAQYRNQFWVLNPEAQQYAMLGIHGQSTWIDQSRELMICSFGSYPVQVDPLGIKCMQTFWKTIANTLDSQHQ